MYNISLSTFLVLTALLAGLTGCSQESPREFFYVGTTSSGSEHYGIHVLEFDRNNLSFELLQVTSEDKASPTFQAAHPHKPVLYSASRSPFSGDSGDQIISAYLIDEPTGALTLINKQSAMGESPAHVSVDPLGEFVYVSNYRTGNISVYRVGDNGSLSEAVDVVQHEGSSVHPTRQQQPHIHAVDPSSDGRFVYVSDMGIDHIRIYAVDRETGRLTPASNPWFESTPGSGPRHLTFHPNGNFAYSLEDLSSTIAALRVDTNTGALEQIQHVNMLPDDFDEQNYGADIHTSPDGKFLYASNRGHDSLVIYAIDENTGMLTLVGHQSTMGGHPRNFWMDPEGEFVIVANRDDNHLVVFQRDHETGELHFTGAEVTVPRAVCITSYVSN
jgi:6-phosphogluconolactonase